MIDAGYHADTYAEPIDEFLCEVNVKAPILIFRELFSPSGSEPQDVGQMVALCQHAKSGVAQGWSGIPSLFGHPQADTLPAQRHCSVIEGGKAGLE